MSNMLNTAPHPGRHLALVVLLAASVMNVIDGTIINVALPTIQADLSASSTQLEWISAIYILAFATGLLPFGRFGDVFGRRKIFAIGVVGFTLTSGLCGVAPNIEILIAARVIQGISGAAMIPQVLALMRVVFPPQEQGAAFAKFTLASSLSAVSGPLIGGLLLQFDLFELGWRSIFLINLPIGVAVITSLALIPETPLALGLKVDKLGTLIFGASVMCVVLPMIEGRAFGWPWWAFASIAAGIVLGIAFVVLQLAKDRAGASQLLPAALLRNREFMTGLLHVTALFSVSTGLILVLGIYLQSGIQLSAFQTGLVISPFPAGVTIASLVTRKMSPRSQPRRILVGAVIMLAAMVCLRFAVLSANSATDAWSIAMPVLLAGFGNGIAVVALFPKVLASVQTSNAGAGSGALQAAQHVGVVVGIATIGEIFFASLYADATTGSAPWANAIANATLGSSCLVAALLILLTLQTTLREAR